MYIFLDTFIIHSFNSLIQQWGFTVYEGIDAQQHIDCPWPCSMELIVCWRRETLIKMCPSLTYVDTATGLIS